jgi:hypothetical protein
MSQCFLGCLVVAPASKEVDFDSGGVYFFVVHGFCVSWLIFVIGSILV